MQWKFNGGALLSNCFTSHINLSNILLIKKIQLNNDGNYSCGNSTTVYDKGQVRVLGGLFGVVFINITILRSHCKYIMRSKCRIQ